MYEAIKELAHYTDILTGGVQMQLEKMKLKHFRINITVIFLVAVSNATYF